MVLLMAKVDSWLAVCFRAFMNQWLTVTDQIYCYELLLVGPYLQLDSLG